MKYNLETKVFSYCLGSRNYFSGGRTKVVNTCFPVAVTLSLASSAKLLVEGDPQELEDTLKHLSSEGHPIIPDLNHVSHLRK